MGQVIKVDFRKAAPETAARAPLDERAVWAWREAQKANDPFGNELSRRFAEARARYHARNIIPRGLGVSEYRGDWHANDEAHPPTMQRFFAQLLAALAV